MKKIIKNVIQCNCGDIIVSKNVHDFVTCRCGCCLVDDGNEYLNRGFANSADDFTDMSEFVNEDENHGVELS